MTMAASSSLRTPTGPTLLAAETREIWQRTVFVWGVSDCILSVCDHVRRMTGVDPAAPWRGTYDDEAGARAILQPFGGTLGIMRHGMAAFPEGEPADGRPVVCDIAGREIAGVVFGGRIGFMAERGLIEMRAPVLAAWVI